ncbi:MAG: tetratricopeptide repeat protein [Verrucomicrobiales bacterium]
MLLGAVALATTSQYAQEEGAALTADELFTEAINTYASGNYEKAEALLGSFVGDYGSNEQAQEALSRLLPMLALSKIQLKKFTEAPEVIDQALAHQPPISAMDREELTFWRGISDLQEEQWESARNRLIEFAQTYPRSNKRVEAVILAGTTHALAEEWEELETFFAELIDSVPSSERGRIVVLRLYGLLARQERETALAMVVAEFANIEQMLQIAGFQTLVLQLGSEFLDAEEYRPAIACLQRVWSRQRILDHQTDRLTRLKSQREAAELQKNAYEIFRLGGLIARVERELESFGQIEAFDPALRLRLASAYLGMERYLEAALILEAMLQEMKPDPIVEQAAVTLLQCWNEIERWPKLVEAASTFLERFPKSERGDLVMFMKGQAEQSLFDFAASVETFDALEKKFSKSDFAARGAFMAGFGVLSLEEYEPAIKRFEEVERKYRDHSMAEVSFYWRAMAYSFATEHEKARELFLQYRDQHKNGRFFSDAGYRMAYEAHSLRDFATSIAELRQFVQDYPGHEMVAEAYVLLGDALANEGEIEEAIAAYRSVPDTKVKFFEEAWFKIGKAYQAMDEQDQLREHMLEFVRNYPASPRMPEAVYQVGRTYMLEEEPERAQDLYWDTIAEHGDQPNMRGIEDLFGGLQRLYRGPEEQLQLIGLLRDLAERAEAREEPTLQMRVLWAQAQIMQRTDHNQAMRLLEQAGDLADVSTTNPMLLADFADSLRSRGITIKATDLYEGLIKWNPRAPQKDRALAGLGFIALEAGREAEAMDYFRRFQQETFSSPLSSKIALTQSDLLVQRGQYSEAITLLEESILGNEYAPGQDKAQALWDIGQIWTQRGDETKAFAYYQRIYVMYGRWSELVAKAYLQCGQILEKRNDLAGARKTYDEMLSRQELAEFPETQEARQRAERLPAVEESEPVIIEEDAA